MARCGRAVFRLLVIAGLAVVGCSGSLRSDRAPEPQERARALEAISRANLGLAYLEQDRAGKSAEEFEHVIGLFPAEPLGHANLAVARFRLDQLPAAEASVTQALGLDPAQADLHVLLGEIQQWQGRDGDAIGSFERAVALSPAHTRAHYKLSKLAEASEDWSGAIDHLNAVLRAEPDNLAALLDLGPPK